MRKSRLLLHIQGLLGKSGREHCVREGHGFSNFSNEAYSLSMYTDRFRLNLHIFVHYSAEDALGVRKVENKA